MELRLRKLVRGCWREQNSPIVTRKTNWNTHCKKMFHRYILISCLKRREQLDCPKLPQPSQSAKYSVQKEGQNGQSVEIGLLWALPTGAKSYISGQREAKTTHKTDQIGGQYYLLMAGEKTISRTQNVSPLLLAVFQCCSPFCVHSFVSRTWPKATSRLLVVCAHWNAPTAANDFGRKSCGSPGAPVSYSDFKLLVKVESRHLLSNSVSALNVNTSIKAGTSLDHFVPDTTFAEGHQMDSSSTRQTLKKSPSEKHVLFCQKWTNVSKMPFLACAMYVHVGAVFSGASRGLLRMETQQHSKYGSKAVRSFTIMCKSEKVFWARASRSVLRIRQLAVQFTSTKLPVAETKVFSENNKIFDCVLKDGFVFDSLDLGELNVQCQIFKGFSSFLNKKTTTTTWTVHWCSAETCSATFTIFWDYFLQAMLIHGKLHLTSSGLNLDEVRSLLQKSLRRKERDLILKSCKELIGTEHIALNLSQRHALCAIWLGAWREFWHVGRKR